MVMMRCAQPSRRQPNALFAAALSSARRWDLTALALFSYVASYYYYCTNLTSSSSAANPKKKKKRLLLFFRTDDYWPVSMSLGMTANKQATEGGAGGGSTVHNIQNSDVPYPAPAQEQASA